MPAGTITLTNNSTAVIGSGTAFPTELKANDFLVAVVGGTTYTLGVKSVESATALTFTTAYGGPTTSGLAWTPIPNGTLVGITAQIAADTARAIRGLNYDKQNWQQVYSASGNITVTLPDDSTWTGPSWKYLSDNMATKVGGTVPVVQGGTGATNPEDARKKLGLDNVAYQINHDYRAIVSYAIPQNFPLGVSGGIQDGSKFGVGSVVGLLSVRGWPDKSGDESCFQIAVNTGVQIFRIPVLSGDGNWYFENYKIWNQRNTTTDTNGFIKAASPVVKIYSDGIAVTNAESEGAAVERVAIGEYLITGVLGLNSDAAWGGIDGGFEIPVDRNKQPRLWLDYEMNPDGSILVKTYHRTHPEAPEFARNRIGHSNDDGSFTELVKNGEPVDIPADSFVSVRVDMPADSIWNQKQLASEKVRLEVEFKDADGSEEAQS